VNAMIEINSYTVVAQRMSETYELLDDRPLDPPILGDFEQQTD
jgi:hypothetical protein